MSLTVTGPSGLVGPGDSIIFISSVDNPKNYPVTYNWSVSRGEIVAGQATSSITVIYPETGENVVATVHISDMSGYCPSLSASEATVICDCVDALLIVEFALPESKTLRDETKDRLDRCAVTLLNNPSATGHFVGKFGKNKSENWLKAELNKFVEYLVKVRKLDKSRITFATTESDSEPIIQFWIIPAGAKLPGPKN